MARVLNAVPTLIKALCTIHVFHHYIGEISPCAGASMLPTISPNKTLILHSRLLSTLSPIPRGSLVTASSPLDPNHFILKRVIGIPGDVIAVDPSRQHASTPGWRKNDEYVLVPPGHVWLAGDNTSNSIDSRDYGPVPMGLIRGRVLARVYPDPTWFGEGEKRVNF